MKEASQNPDRELFPPGDFDAWADHYDHSVLESGSFPFYGYGQVLEIILNLSQARPGDSILDLGTGTGNLAALFSNLGCQVWGLDFSAQMLVRARRKLPQAVFGLADLRVEWPLEFQRRFHEVVSGYTFHHFTLEEKVSLIRRLFAEYLLPGGRVIIGDVAFENASAQDQLHLSLGDEWEDEFYWIADEMLDALATAGLRSEFYKISACAGVFHISHSDI